MTKGWKANSIWRSPRVTLLTFFLLVAFPAFFPACTITEPEEHQTGTVIYDGSGSRLCDEGSVHTYINIRIADADNWRHDQSEDRLAVERSVRKGAATKAESWWLVRRMDLFVFNDDGIQGLDSYKRDYAYSTGQFTAASSSGDKIIVAIANSQLTNDDIADIRVYEDLIQLKTRLADETAEYPLMTGETRVCVGEQSECSVTLYPMLSEIFLSSVTCKMDGAYAGKTLQKVKAYLTNVNGRTEMMRWDGFRPSEILNQGKLSESDMQALNYQRLLYSYLGNGQKIDNGYSYGKTSLYCYPNDAAEESLGTPYTTLVIEGLLDGKTNYYPVRINRKGYGHSVGVEGISRNARYTMNVTITGPGADSPDGEVPDRSTVTEGSMTVHPANFITGHDGERIHVWVDVFPEETEVMIDEDDLDFDRERGIYDYEIDEDGKGVWLTLLKGGSGAFIINAGYPVNDGLLVIIVCNP